MKRILKKEDFPVWKIRKFLEPGPVVLVSSHWRGKTNIMTMGWHTVMEFSPSRIGCFITSANYSYEMIRNSKECVINIPTVSLLDELIGIGNCKGKKINKFNKFGLTAQEAEFVSAPLIGECYANFECRITDTSLLRKYSFFVMEVVKAHVAAYPKYPKTVHYRGEGEFMVSGKNISMPEKFKKQNL
jgi:flavin reductase (DIM6/NTAB) family NADH-FMN oxidoreductase RutF